MSLFIHASIPSFVDMFLHMYAFLYICICMYECMYVCRYVCMYAGDPLKPSSPDCARAEVRAGSGRGGAAVQELLGAPPGLSLHKLLYR